MMQLPFKYFLRRLHFYAEEKKNIITTVTLVVC